MNHKFFEKSQELQPLFKEGVVLLIDKPLEWTSFSVVNKVRYRLSKIEGVKRIKVGHAGTLDPLATGLLILCTGKYTKEIDQFQGMKKRYTGTITLGATTPSYDLETEVDMEYPTDHLTKEKVMGQAQKFVGKIQQKPPIFSAIKSGGERLYKKARRGEDFEIKSREVEVDEFKIEKVDMPSVDFSLDCSKGTYVRSLAHDFGQSLDSGAYLSRLRRERIGEFDVVDAWNLQELIEVLDEILLKKAIMSVELNGLTKEFGDQVAVNEISFTAKPGEIVGFLGPNGAGKSTTMKMLTCYTEPTRGTATVCGYDIITQPKDVRACIGYLPEHNPLYKDMYVKEFLRFIAGIHKVSKPMKRIEELIDMTGLGLEQHKLIGALSKGYRQRVGLAQAMMHDPEVLILDEPTSGLDPNQLNDIRQLIQTLGEKKTVIFSTHIMQEVTALCDRVLIINRGNLVADDPIQVLQQRAISDHKIFITFEKEVKKDAFSDIESVTGVKELSEAGGSRYEIMASKDVRKELFEWAVRNNQIILELTKSQVSVENVFRQLTQETNV